MLTVQVTVICIAAAVICAAVRLQRPEMAMAISLAVSLAVILLLWQGYSDVHGIFSRFKALVYADESMFVTVLKAAGIAIISELGAQICLDAGERTLAGRISLAARLAMLSMCIPMLERMLEQLGNLPY